MTRTTPDQEIRNDARAPSPAPTPPRDIRVHVIQTGTLVGNKTFLRGKGFSSLLRPREDYEFPAYSYLVEHPEGLIAIDTGMTTRVRTPRPRMQRRFVPDPRVGQEIGPAMRDAGLDPAAVRRVVLTHLDWDHAGGLSHFPHATTWVHCPEYEFAFTVKGRLRYEPKLWPPGFDPTLYDLDVEPYGPFPASRALTASGDVRLVPLAGHSIGQVGVIVETRAGTLFFAADHVLRQDWFCEDYEAGRLHGLGTFYPKLAVETSRRIHRLAESRPIVLLPSHDAEAPARLASMEPLIVSQPST